MTVNMSGRGVDEQVLKNVVNYDWEDHKAPPFDMLFTFFLFMGIFQDYK